MSFQRGEKIKITRIFLSKHQIIKLTIDPKPKISFTLESGGHFVRVNFKKP
jgi:hypothetical protein